MIGSNADEMSLSAPQTVLPFMVTDLINAAVPPAYQQQALQLYPPGSNATQARQSYVGILTDSQFTTTTRRTAQCVSQNQAEAVWRYFFTFKHTIPALAAYGSYHGMELFYVFNTWENATLGSGFLFKPQDDSVQKAMLAYWVNFARTGNPNGAGLPAWPQYHSSSDCYLDIKATPDGGQCGLRKVQSDLWDNAVGYIHCTSSAGIQDVKMDDDLLAYPNPTNGIITLDIQDKRKSSLVCVYDFSGKQVLSLPNAYQVDFSGLPKGIYLLQLIRDGKSEELKIVRQ